MAVGLQGAVNGTLPPLDLASRVHVPQDEVPSPGPIATSEASADEEQSPFEVEQGSPAAFTVPAVTPFAQNLSSNGSSLGGNLLPAPNNSSSAVGATANSTSPATEPGQAAGASPNIPDADGSSPFQISPEASSSPSPAAGLQAASPGPGLSAEALLAQKSPSPGAPVAPLLIPVLSAASMAPAEAVLAPAAANAPGSVVQTTLARASAPTALGRKAQALSPLPVPSSSANPRAPLTQNPDQPTTITSSTSPSSSTSSSASPASPQVTLGQTLATQALPFASPAILRSPDPPPATLPSPPLTSPYTYASHDAAPAPGPITLPASLLPYGLPLPVHFQSAPAPAPGPAAAPVTAPALAPGGAALAPAAATAAQAAPSSLPLSRMLLASGKVTAAAPLAEGDTAQLDTALAQTTSGAGYSAPRPAPEPNTAARLSGSAGKAGAPAARADASVSSAGDNGGKGGAGLGAKDIGIMAGAIAAGAVLLSE